MRLAVDATEVGERLTNDGWRAAGERPPWSPHLVFEAALSADECEQVIGRGEVLSREAALLEDDGGRDVDDALRRAAVTWLEPDPELAWLYQRLDELVEEANEVYGFALVGFGEDLQYTLYDEPGSFYTWHQDGLDGDVATRKLSLVVQLSDPDDYEGADLEFLDVVEDYEPAERDEWRAAVRARGSVVVFPAFEYHRVTPLRSGVRRSLVCWVSGPRFR
jgi:PKHD-type hydroxylase